jgi:alanine racemase
MRRTWAEISASALQHNLEALRRQSLAAVAAAAQRPQLCAVVKANAYGHGADLCARLLEANGVGWLAVTSPEDGLALRRAGRKARILLLSGFDREDASALIEHDLTPAVWHRGHIEWLEQELAARRLERFPVHLKLDSGMSRLGASEPQVAEVAAALASSNRVAVEAVFSHFSSSEQNSPVSERQRERFLAMTEALLRAGVKFDPAALHLANTGAVLRGMGTGFLNRVGIGLYGYSPGGVAPAGDLRPVLSWKARVIGVREIAAGTAVGYGGCFVAQRRTRIATLAVGYADGYPRRMFQVHADRSLESRPVNARPPQGAAVLLRGRRAPVAGNVSMDLTTIDATDVPGVELGDEAVLIGRQGDESITAEDLALLAGTIVYEVLCAIGPRVPRLETQ